MTGANQAKDRVSIRPNLCLMASISTLISVFGLTWLFAIFTFSAPGLRETFQLLFTVFNSFQGLVAFLSFCIQDKKGFESLKDIITCGMHKKVLKSSQAKFSSRKLPMTSKQMNTGKTGLDSSSSTYAPLTSSVEYKSATLTNDKEAPLQTKALDIKVDISEHEQKTGQHSNAAAQFDKEKTKPTVNAPYHTESVSIFDKEMKKSTSLKAQIKRYSTTKHDVEELKVSLKLHDSGQESSDEQDATTQL